MSTELVTMYNEQKMYCSLNATDDKEKAVVFNASSNPDYQLSDMIGKVINLKHIYVEEVEITNEETGEVNTAPRVVLIDSKNKSYGCVSVGIFNSIRRLLLTFGDPEEWVKPIPVLISQKKINGNKNILILSVDPASL